VLSARNEVTWCDRATKFDPTFTTNDRSIFAAAGLYAVISYGIQQRNREIGVRLALGATRATILGMIFKEGAVLVAGGIIAGFAIALALARLVASQMYGVNEHDPLSFAVVGLILSVISLVACGIAARRAMNIDPIVSLRCE
jgi:ABC-type antimicrobial peptide transport system permease subunit